MCLLLAVCVHVCVQACRDKCVVTLCWVSEDVFRELVSIVYFVGEGSAHLFLLYLVNYWKIAGITGLQTFTTSSDFLYGLLELNSSCQTYGYVTFIYLI